MLTYQQQYIDVETCYLNEHRITLEFRWSNFHGIFGPSPTCYELSAFRLILCMPDRFNEHHISADVCCHQLAQGKERWIIFTNVITFPLHPMMTSVMVDGTCIILEIFGSIVERVNGVDFIQATHKHIGHNFSLNRALSQLKFSVNTILLVAIWFVASLLKLSRNHVSWLKI